MEKYRNNPSIIPNCFSLYLRVQDILILSGQQLRN